MSDSQETNAREPPCDLCVRLSLLSACAYTAQGAGLAQAGLGGEQLLCVRPGFLGRHTLTKNSRKLRLGAEKVVCTPTPCGHRDTSLPHPLPQVSSIGRCP